VLIPILILVPFLAPGEAWSQDFPSKPITIYIGFEPGATTDITSRALVEGAQKTLGVPILVESKPGGGSSVAATLLATKKPDGYSLALISTTALVTTPLIIKLNYDIKDFTYLFTFARFACGICVKTESPFKTLKDMIEYARKSPEGASYAATINAPTHLVTEFLARQAKVKFKLIPYKGGAPAATALLGGHVDFMAGAGMQQVYLRQGLFRMLAVTNSDQRHPNYPDVPTLTELGYQDMPSPTYVFLAPKGLPQPVYEKLANAFRKAAHSPEFKKVLESIETPFIYKEGKNLEAQVFEEYRFFSKSLKELGVIK
jgi:tripartite-type tricarboxylate transporter receptor subunit TctC